MIESIKNKKRSKQKMAELNQNSSREEIRAYIDGIMQSEGRKK